MMDGSEAGDRTTPLDAPGLFASLHRQLCAIAQEQMAQERRAHTLQATALVNEAYLRMAQAGIVWSSRGAFFVAAAEAMRRILIDHARARGAEKRGGGRAALTISGIADLAAPTEPAGILALDDAISRLEGVDPQAAAVVRLRFYAGLEIDATAAALGISERTVKRDWAFARAWLHQALTAELEG